MGTRIFRNVAIRTALFALAVAASATACSAQDNTARPTMTVTAGQGGYVVVPDTRPAPASYALTGEQNPSAQSLRTWQAQVGPVFSVGNARIVIAPTR